MRLLSLPNEFSFVLIKLVPKFVAGLDHQFMQVMSKFRIKWHRDSLSRLQARPVCEFKMDGDVVSA